MKNLISIYNERVKMQEDSRMIAEHLAGVRFSFNLIPYFSFSPFGKDSDHNPKEFWGLFRIDTLKEDFAYITLEHEGRELTMQISRKSASEDDDEGDEKINTIWRRLFIGSTNEAGEVTERALMEGEYFMLIFKGKKPHPTKRNRFYNEFSILAAKEAPTKKAKRYLEEAESEGPEPLEVF